MTELNKILNSNNPPKEEILDEDYKLMLRSNTGDLATPSNKPNWRWSQYEPNHTQGKTLEQFFDGILESWNLEPPLVKNMWTEYEVKLQGQNSYQTIHQNIFHNFGKVKQEVWLGQVVEMLKALNTLDPTFHQGLKPFTISMESIPHYTQTMHRKKGLTKSIACLGYTITDGNEGDEASHYKKIFGITHDYDKQYKK